MRSPLFLLFVSSLPIQTPAQSVTGQWSVELWLDSAGAIGPRPTARYLRGQVAFDTLYADSGTASAGRWTRRYSPGRYAIDLRRFFGAQVGRDVSTTIVAPFDSTFASEVEADYTITDTVEMNYIPRISHGGITATGTIRGDTLVGTWYMRAYCCGAQGHFRMVRISHEPVTFRRSPVPPPLPPLPLDRGVEVRVRVRDSGTGQFFAAQHDLVRFNPQSTTCCYSTGTQPDGWGVYFWLPPGRYQVELSRFDCNGHFASLRTPVLHEFRGAAADTLEITLEVNRDTVLLSPTYNNPEGLRCRDLRGP